jgi:isoamylase
MATSERELHDYIAAIAERGDVRAGAPLPLGAFETGGGANFASSTR